jgi:asparagine synthetase B (glutamine-hydrolysing)
LIIFIDASSFIISYLILAVIPFNLAFTQYEEYGEEFVDMLDGMFSFVLLDTRDKTFIAARDAIGICPLYMGWGLDGMYSE